MEKLSGGQVVVKVLEAEGVQKAFCVPGESYLGVIDGLYQHPDIELITNRHEGGASFMAEAYAKTSNQVGVCMATRGPGATNLSIGLHTAMQDSTPLVALIGQVERPFMGKEAFQEVDYESYFSHLCKWSIEINEVERIPELLHRAFYEARSGRPGPVVVSLPHDMLEDSTTYQVSNPIEFNRPIADTLTVQKVVDKIEKAKRPFVIAGGGVLSANARTELEDFVEKLNLPVASAFRRFNVLSNDHKNYAGWLGFGMDKALKEYIQSSDLIIAIGTRLSQVTTQDYTLLGDNSRIIQIDICESTIGKSYEVEFGVISDAKAFLQSANSLIESDKDVTKSEIINQINQTYIKHSTPPTSKNRNDMQYVDLNCVMEEIMQLTPKNTIITGDAGNFHGWLARYFRFTNSKQYVGATSGAMGYGLPSALGVKVAKPNYTVMSFSGDGGFMMTSQELETANRHGIKIIAIVINNNMYGTIRSHQEKHFPGRVKGTSLINPSFSKMGELYGCFGATINTNEQFLPVFKEALNSDKSYVIEILTDPNILSVAQSAK